MIDTKKINKELTKVIQQSYFLKPTDELLHALYAECTDILYDNGFSDEKSECFNPVIIGVNLHIEFIGKHLLVSYRYGLDGKITLSTK